MNVEIVAVVAGNQNKKIESIGKNSRAKSPDINRKYCRILLDTSTNFIIYCPPFTNHCEDHYNTNR